MTHGALQRGSRWGARARSTEARPRCDRRYHRAAMNRTELERLDRDSLISRAEASGVVRARILTRPELIYELIQRSTQPGEVVRARGLFGRARDLLARVIERGLHLPDAAER